jgi:hypothetical protein
VRRLKKVAVITSGLCLRCRCARRGQSCHSKANWNLRSCTIVSRLTLPSIACFGLVRYATSRHRTDVTADILHVGSESGIGIDQNNHSAYHPCLTNAWSGERHSAYHGDCYCPIQALPVPVDIHHCHDRHISYSRNHSDLVSSRELLKAAITKSKHDCVVPSFGKEQAMRGIEAVLYC